MRVTPESNLYPNLTFKGQTPDNYIPLWRKEHEFQNAVRTWFLGTGWSFYHTWNSLRSRPGFPDLMAWRGERLIAAELKMPNGKLSGDQALTLLGLSQTPIEVYLWLPWDEAEIMTIIHNHA